MLAKDDSTATQTANEFLRSVAAEFSATPLHGKGRIPRITIDTCLAAPRAPHLTPLTPLSTQPMFAAVSPLPSHFAASPYNLALYSPFQGAFDALSLHHDLDLADLLSPDVPMHPLLSPSDKELDAFLSAPIHASHSPLLPMPSTHYGFPSYNLASPSTPNGPMYSPAAFAEFDNDLDILLHLDSSRFDSSTSSSSMQRTASEVELDELLATSQVRHLDQDAKREYYDSQRKTIPCPECGKLYKNVEAVSQHSWKEHKKGAFFDQQNAK
ncbi:hypothetical protein HDU98_009184, partial [Podochytrium sp. JEL0797]